MSLLRCPLPVLALLSTELMSNVDLTVMPGDRVGLVGQNGSGKSTLLQCIAGYRSMDEGKCLVKNGARMGEPTPFGSSRDCVKGCVVQSPIFFSFTGR